MAKKVGLPDFVKSRHDNHFVEEISSRTRTSIIRKIPVEKIVPNLMQPRKDFGNIDELARSIGEKGILEPILVRAKDGKFEIIAGERRFRAAKIAGLREIPCIEFEIPDNEALELSIIENIQRKDLNVYEKAYSLKSLSDIYGYTHEEIAKKLGKS
ncbi:MAG: ParB/RepB/Spo0J family partition protein, partial [Candidatus Aminicenantes bacterium]|nr:ParB/RepB/Spo0J family partition protein [Candidatus Aminicenantes bacterium]